MADEHPDIGSPTPEDHTTVEKRLAHSLSLLRATFDSTADGILVADGQGRIETFNQRFVQLWQLPADVLAGGDDNAALAFVLDQLIDPEGFLAKVNDLYANPDAESFDVPLKDGRVSNAIRGRSGWGTWSWGASGASATSPGANRRPPNWPRKCSGGARSSTSRATVSSSST
jgi:PAS domain-containing protein